MYLIGRSPMNMPLQLRAMIALSACDVSTKFSMHNIDKCLQINF